MDETTDRVVCGMGWNWVGVDIYDTNAVPHANVYTVGGKRENGRGKEKWGALGGQMG